MTTEVCPLCGSNQQGEPIKQEYIDKGYYGNTTHYSRTIMIEIRGVYDGGLYYMCPDCGKAFQRHDPESRLGKLAQPYIDKHNRGEFPDEHE